LDLSSYILNTSVIYNALVHEKSEQSERIIDIDSIYILVPLPLIWDMLLTWKMAVIHCGHG